MSQVFKAVSREQVHDDSAESSATAEAVAAAMDCDGSGFGGNSVIIKRAHVRALDGSKGDEGSRSCPKAILTGFIHLPGCSD